MCKLAAMVNLESNKLSHLEAGKVTKILEHLFYVNSFGQTDGAGMMMMQTEGSFAYHKRGLPSPDFIQTKWYKSAKKLMADSFAIGLHTRYSTVGGNSDANSHPFKQGKYLLMQNGTISTTCAHRSLVPGIASPCEVDSESVAWSMKKQGIDATFDRYKGAGVFMFIDTEELSFNIVKNSERTLNVAKLKGKDVYIFATEAAALQLAFSRAGAEYDSILTVDDDMLHTWEFGTGYRGRELIVDDGWLVQSSYSHRRNDWKRKQPKEKWVLGEDGRYVLGKPQAGTQQLPASINPEDKEREDDFSSSFQVYVDDCSVCSTPLFSTDHLYLVDNTSQYCCVNCLDTLAYSFGKQAQFVDDWGTV